MTREEAIEIIKQDIPCEYDTDLIEALEMATIALEQEPKAGHWIPKSEGDGFKNWNCSKCGMIVRNSQRPWYKYCPDCGCRMESEDNNADND